MQVSKLDRNKIIMEYLPKINFIVKSLKHQNLPPSITEEDLFQIGVLGLIDAINKFDESKNVKFSSYAEIRIRGQILDALRNLDYLPRTIRRKMKNIENAVSTIEAEKKREATTEEIAQYLGMDEEEYIKYAKNTFDNMLISLDADIDEDEEEKGKLWQIIAISDDTPDRYIEEKELKIILSDIIKNELDEKEKILISLYYYEELTMKEIGEVLGISESRVSQIHTKAMLKLRKALERYFEK